MFFIEIVWIVDHNVRAFVNTSPRDGVRPPAFFGDKTNTLRNNTDFERFWGPGPKDPGPDPLSS